MSDARTFGLPSSSRASTPRLNRRSAGSSSNRGSRRDSDTKSWGYSLSSEGSIRRSEVRDQSLERPCEDVNPKFRMSGFSAKPPQSSSLPRPLPPSAPHSLPSSPQPPLKLPPPPPPPQPLFTGVPRSDRTVFMKYLGLEHDSGATHDPRDFHRLSQSEHNPQMQSSQWLHPSQHASTLYQNGDQFPWEVDEQQMTVSQRIRKEEEEEDFSEEECFYELVGLMLLHARSGRSDAETRLEAVRAYAGEFGDRICKFHARQRLVFPFYQPEMFSMLNLLTSANFQTDRSRSDALRSLIEQLQGVHLRMQLFLWPEVSLAEAVGEFDDAVVARLILDFAEQVCLDLRRTSVATSARADDKNMYDDKEEDARHLRCRYARRRIAALTAALDHYTRTTESRRRRIFARMRNIVALVGASSPAALICGGSSDSSLYFEALAGLYSYITSCFGDFAVAATAPAVAVSHVRARVGSSSTSAMTQVNTAEAAADILPAGEADTDAAPQRATAVPDTATASTSVATDGRQSMLTPQETVALQLMAHLERLIAISFLPGERVNAVDFRAAYDELNRWWLEVATAAHGGGRQCNDKRVVAKLSAIREEYQRALIRRTDARCVKRLCTEAETAWDLVEAAKLMVTPVSEERTAANLTSRTSAELRDATLGLVASALARLYLYQVSQDPSALSLRLRADLQRLVGRLADCGTAAPPLALLRLRLCYLRARQFSDLLRPHPQGCLILELAQAYRILRGSQITSSGAAGLTLTLSAPLGDYKKFYQHLSNRDLRVLSFEARAPITDKNAQLTKPNCLKRVEVCCQCTIDLAPAATPAGASCRPRCVALQVRPDSCQGRANAAMRMISDIGESVRYSGFRLELDMPPNYRPLAAFVDTSRPID